MIEVVEVKMSKFLITGVNGFVGFHLARYLKNNGHVVLGTARQTHADIMVAKYLDNYYQADLVHSWPEADEVDGVVHLAGLSAVGNSFLQPQKYINVNSSMITNMGEYFLKKQENPRIIVVSSGSVYDSSVQMPIDEESPLGFISPYAVSKILNENQARYYLNRGLDIVIARPFNHVGPGLHRGFILSNLYDAIKKTGLNQAVEFGNLTTERDYIDVRDIVRAYAMLLEAVELKETVYNIGSGKSFRGEMILKYLKEAMNREDVTYFFNSKMARPSDIKKIRSDSTRLMTELNWRPEISLQQSVRDFVMNEEKI